MCIIAQSLASKQPATLLAALTMAGKPTNNGSNTKQFIACYAAPPLSHTHTYLWIFSKAAILCFTDHNARGDDEGGREGVQL